MFKIGEKVACIHSFIPDDFDIRKGNVLPVKGEIYTIRVIQVYDVGIYFLLEELVNPILIYTEGLGELVFSSDKFRKLDYAFGIEICERLQKENDAVQLKTEELHTH